MEPASATASAWADPYRPKSDKQRHRAWPRSRWSKHLWPKRPNDTARSDDRTRSAVADHHAPATAAAACAARRLERSEFAPPRLAATDDFPAHPESAPPHRAKAQPAHPP